MLLLVTLAVIKGTNLEMMLSIGLNIVIGNAWLFDIKSPVVIGNLYV